MAVGVFALELLDVGIERLQDRPLLAVDYLEDNGLIALISSAASEGAFVEKFAEEHKEDPKVKVRRLSLYEADPEFLGKPRFHITVTRDLLDGTIETKELNPPEELRSRYEGNLSKALREIDGLASHTLDPFYLSKDWVSVLGRLNKGRADPFPDRGMKDKKVPHSVLPMDVAAGLAPDFHGDPKWEYYCHCDLAKADVAAGNCAAGFAMVHKEIVDNGDIRIVLDLSVRFITHPGTTLDPKHVRDFVHHLKHQRGFNISSVTYDQWQSEESIIRLKEQGIFSERLPVGYDQHTMVKNMLIGGGLDIFTDTMLLRELKGLEDKVTKVEPALGSMKDEADAFAGAVWGAYTSIDEGFRPKVKKRAAMPAVRRKPGFYAQGTMGRGMGQRGGGGPFTGL